MAIVLDTTSIPGTTIVYDNVNGGVAIDYSAYYERLATAAEATRESIATIEADLGRFRVLADPDQFSDSTVDGGSGIRVSTPYSILERALLWQGIFAKVNNAWEIPAGEVATNEQLNEYVSAARAFVNAFEEEFGDLK